MKKVLIAGASGAIGRQLADRLLAQGCEVSGIVRSQSQKEELDNAGIHGHVVEQLVPGEALTAVTKGQDVVIFAAGSKGKALEAVDRDGAIHLADVAVSSGVKRFVVLSSIYAGRPDEGPDNLRAYFHAKHAADVHIQGLPLDYTIVRPGFLHNETPTGKAQTGEAFDGPTAKISRHDVARILAGIVDEPNTIGKNFEIIEGEL